MIVHGVTLTSSDSSAKDAFERALALATTLRSMRGSGKATVEVEADADRSMQLSVQQFNHWRNVFDASTFVDDRGSR